MYEPIYLRRGPGDEFDCQLPAEARIELEEIPSRQTYHRREPALRPAPPPQVFLRPPSPVSPPPPPEVVYRAPIPVPPPPAKRSHGAAVIGTVAIVALFLYAMSHKGGSSSSTAPLESRSVFAPSSQPVEVRRALPAAVVEVRRALPVSVIEIRRALPAVPRALPVTSAASPVPNGQWQSVRFYDGSVVPVCYQGELPSSAALPAQGRFIGEEWSTGKTSWIWMTLAGTSFPSWVDP